MIKIGEIDLGKVVIELQFQTKINELLIERIMNERIPKTQNEIEQIKKDAADYINKYYGKPMVTYTSPQTKSPISG